MTSYETLLYEERGAVAIVTMNRPDVHNAFNTTMQHELQHVWQSLRRNRGINAVVLTGAGDEAFTTGLDREDGIAGYIEDPDGQRSTGRVSGSPFMFDDVGRFINPKQNDLWKPVVCAVNGMACAGALYLLGESDVIVAAEHATFFDPHVTYGMVAGFEGAHLLQKLPLGETLRLVLMGSHERMSAQRAHAVGLVSEVVPLDQLMGRALRVAEVIASAPPLAIQATLRAVWMAHESGRRQAIAQVSMPVLLGSEYENIKGGQDTFHAPRPDWELR